MRLSRDVEEVADDVFGRRTRVDSPGELGERTYPGRGEQLPAGKEFSDGVEQALALLRLAGQAKCANLLVFPGHVPAVQGEEVFDPGARGRDEEARVHMNVLHEVAAKLVKGIRRSAGTPSFGGEQDPGVFDAAAGNTDAAEFMAGITTDQLWFRHVGNNLEVSIIGTTDKLTVQNWYLGSAYHVEQFRTADNHVLLDTQVEALVQAMAAFTPPAAGQSNLPASYQPTLAPVLAANWH